MSRIYEALRRAEGAPVDENEHAPDGKAARGAAKRVTLEEYPRETPVPPEPLAATPAARQDRPVPFKADRPDPVQPVHLPPPAHVPAMRTEHQEPPLRPQPVVPPPPEPSLPDFDELLAPAAPLRIDRVVTTEDEGERQETTAPPPVAKSPRVTPLADEDSSSLTIPAIRRPASPAPAMRSEPPPAAGPAARTDRPIPSAVPPASGAERSAALQAVRQSRSSTPAPNDRPAPRSEHPAAEGPASIWSSSVEGITSKAQRVDKRKGWLKSIFG